MSNTGATIETEVAPSSRHHVIAKAKRWGTLIAKFVSVQIIVQAIGLITGIFLVRMLSQRQYAYFTIANTMQGTISILADSGISIGLSAIGGKVWHDRYRFGQLINTALQLRKVLMTAAVLIVTPILIWMLIKNGASTVYAILLALAMLVGVGAQLTTGVLEVVPRLHSQVSRLQKLDMYSAISRLILLAGAYLASLNAAVAVLAASASLVLKNRVLSQWVRHDVDTDAPPLESDRAEIISIVRSQLPSTIFYCIQGQVTVWLISVFGNTRNIAEVGALGRVAVIFTIFNSVVSNIISPYFSRCHSRYLLRLRYLQFLAGYIAVSLLLLGLIALFPRQVLWILGRHYSHLQNEIVLMMLSSIVAGLMGITWMLNSAKGWVKLAWLNIPLTLCTQVILLHILDVSSVKGVILFGIYSLTPCICLNFFMSLQGLKSVAVDTDTARELMND